MKADWRKLPRASEVVHALVGLLTQIDAQGKLLKEMPKTVTYKVHDTVDVPSPASHMGVARMVVKWNNPVQKAIWSHPEYMASVVTVIMKLIHIVDAQEHKTLRALHYEVAMKTPQLKRYIADIALTLDMHPANLGIESEESGRFYVGQDVHFNIRYCQNLFKVAQAAKDLRTDEGYLKAGAIMNRHICQRARFPAGMEYQIPHRVMKILSRGDCLIRAVIVVEHRNVACAIEYWNKNLVFCLVVMTGGYPTSTTREFLNLLSQTYKEAKFLYYSDYDLQGAHIFTMLKYGCKATAWASDLQVCPPLEWAGPTRQQFFDHHEDANDAAEWPQRRDELDHLFIRTMNKTDRSIMKVLNNLKLLDEEPVLREELKSMFDGRGKTHLALLSDGIPFGLETFIAKDVAFRQGIQFVPQRTPNAIRSQDAIAFSEAAPSPATQTQDTDDDFSEAAANPVEITSDDETYLSEAEADRILAMAMSL